MEVFRKGHWSHTQAQLPGMKMSIILNISRGIPIGADTIYVLYENLQFAGKVSR